MSKQQRLILTAVFMLLGLLLAAFAGQISDENSGLLRGLGLAVFIGGIAATAALMRRRA